MTEHRAERPPRLVSTCGYLGVIGLFQAIQAVVVLLGWYGSGEDQVKSFTDPLVSDGIARGDAETIFRVYLGVLALLGASVLVFAVYTAMGHAVSRIMLTIVGPLMSVVGIFQGTFVSVLLSVVALTCVFQLWNADVRRWFALLAGRPAPEAAPGAPAASPHVPSQAVPPAQGPAAPHPQTYAPVAPPARRSDPVKIVSIVALVISSAVALGSALYLVMYEIARDELVRQQLDSGMNWMDLTEAEIRKAYHDLAVLSWIALPLCLVGIVVSTVLLVRRRHRR